MGKMKEKRILNIINNELKNQWKKWKKIFKKKINVSNNSKSIVTINLIFFWEIKQIY
jgi:hypothetical protein